MDKYVIAPRLHRVTEQELQKLRDLPIEEVAERLGLHVVRHKCLCPFHDDHHASMSFKVSRNTYKCFVCGASGGPIDLVMKCLNKDFLDACRWLADEHNVILSEKKYTAEPTPLYTFDAARPASASPAARNAASTTCLC